MVVVTVVIKISNGVLLPPSLGAENPRTLPVSTGITVLVMETEVEKSVEDACLNVIGYLWRTESVQPPVGVMFITLQI